MSDKTKAPEDGSKDIAAQYAKVMHESFVSHGTMLAYPTAFPGATIPIAPDESHITALDTSSEGFVYGGTSGKRAHIFLAMFHGVTGMVFDLKAVDGATHCPAVCCGKTRFFACVNEPGNGGRILATKLWPQPYEGIGAWSFERPAFDDLGMCVPGEPIVHAIADASRDRIVGVTTRHLFTVDMETSKIQVVTEASANGRLAVGSKGNVLGRDETGHLWRFEPQARTLHPKAFKLPGGAWDKTPLVWTRGGQRGLLYTADADGQLFSFDEERGFSAPVGKTLLAPVGPMAITFDGRVFGFCGDGIAKMFCYDPGRREISTLGVAASIFERRRLGYVFGDAVTGREGEIVFGEDDDAGHLWLYFPRIQAVGAI